jgi:hypothetical protein
VTFSLFLPLPPTDVLQIPDYLRRLNVAIQSLYTQLAAMAGDTSYNLDGGAAASVYLLSQSIDCGGA